MNAKYLYQRLEKSFTIFFDKIGNQGMSCKGSNYIAIHISQEHIHVITS